MLGLERKCAGCCLKNNINLWLIVEELHISLFEERQMQSSDHSIRLNKILAKRKKAPCEDDEAFIGRIVIYCCMISTLEFCYVNNAAGIIPRIKNPR